MTQFQEWITRQVQAAGSLRKAAEQAGVSHVTLKKAQDGGKLDLEPLQALAEWRSVPLYTVIGMYLGKPETPDDALSEQVTALLQESEQMRSIFGLMFESDLTADDMADITALVEAKLPRRAA